MSKNKHEVGTTERAVFEIGQSIAVTLPKEFVRAHGIKKGDKILISYNSFVLLEPKKRKKILEEMEKKKKILQQGKEAETE